MIRIEDENRDWLGVSLAAALGLGLGIAAGVAVNDMFGSAWQRVRRLVPRVRRASTARTDDHEALRGAIIDALAEHPATRSLELDVRALGDGIVELTGTAPDVETRDLAGSVARGVGDASIVVNRILISERDRSLRRTLSDAS